MEEKYLLVYYPEYTCETYIEKFKTFKELEKAVKDNNSGKNVIACKILEQKVIEE